jgi:phosphatidylethanolamine-binding protein (PEBP) family uncharacterized protein
VPIARHPRTRPRPLRAATLLTAAVALIALTASGCGESSGRTPSASAASATTAASAAATATAPPRPTTTATRRTQGASHVRAGAPRKQHHAGAALASLGSATRASRLGRARLAKLAIADIALSSPAVQGASATGLLPRRYTCDGANEAPPLRWKNIPAGTAELALFAISTTPVDGKLFFDWALAGIKPSEDGLQSGQLPAGAVLGRNSDGQDRYSLCPASGGSETYVFVLFALPETLNPAPGFEPLALRRQAMQIARHSGLLAVAYRRGGGAG